MKLLPVSSKDYNHREGAGRERDNPRECHILRKYTLQYPRIKAYDVCSLSQHSKIMYKHL